MAEKTRGTCQVICYASSIDFSKLTETLLGNSRAVCYRNVIIVEAEQGSYVVFPYGVVVYWNMPQEVIDYLSAIVIAHAKGILEKQEVECFAYQDGCDVNRFKHDCIELVDNKPLTLIAISHALAQSTNLSVFELQAMQTIESTSAIPKRMARTGSTSLSRKEAAKMRGQLFLTKSEILLKYDLLDTPEFFWEYPELQSIYEMGASYLEIRQRTEILSLKLETIHELFEMLADDLKHKHSSTLEWIIIWLIAVEIVIFLVNDFVLAG